MTFLLNRWVQLALVVGVALFCFWRWMEAREEVGAVNAVNTVITKANDTNQKTITELEGKINSMVAERALDAAEREKLMDQRDQELIAAQRAADRARRERDALFRSTPGCEELGRMDIGALCPAVAGRLQERSRGRGNPDGEDPGRGG